MIRPLVLARINALGQSLEALQALAQPLDLGHRVAVRGAGGVDAAGHRDDACGDAGGDLPQPARSQP